MKAKTFNFHVLLPVIDVLECLWAQSENFVCMPCMWYLSFGKAWSTPDTDVNREPVTIGYTVFYTALHLVTALFTVLVTLRQYDPTCYPNDHTSASTSEYIQYPPSNCTRGLMRSENNGTRRKYSRKYSRWVWISICMHLHTVRRFSNQLLQGKLQQQYTLANSPQSKHHVLCNHLSNNLTAFPLISIIAMHLSQYE